VYTQKWNASCVVRTVTDPLSVILTVQVVKASTKMFYVQSFDEKWVKGQTIWKYVYTLLPDALKGQKHPPLVFKGVQ